MKGTLAGDGGGFNFSEDLFYLSLHCLDSKSGVQHAKTRVCRELLDAWLGKRIGFQGKMFDDSAVTLTEQAGFCPKLVDSHAVSFKSLLCPVDALKIEIMMALIKFGH